MRTFVPKPKAPQRAAPAKSTIPARTHFGQIREGNAIFHLQRTIGNQALLRIFQTNAEELKGGLTDTASPPLGHDFSRIPIHPPAAGAIQTKLAINKSGDEYEQEADRISEQVMRMPEPQLQRACPCGGGCPKCQTEQLGGEHESFQTKRVQASDTGQIAAPPIVHEVLSSPGQPLDSAARTTMESRFGHDFSRVRVHTDQLAAQSAEAVAAHAYTVGSDVVFGLGRYAPTSHDGRRLLAHELAHVAQQRATTTPTIQRDLKAYNKPRTDVLPSFDPMGTSTSLIEMTAEAPAIRTALSALIAADKIKEVKSTNGDTSWFAAQHHKNAQLDEIREALRTAGYAKADALARAIYDIHGEFLYTNQELTTIAPFYSRTTSLGERIELQTDRSMTEWEIGQARRVFGNAINYFDVTIAEGSISAKIAAVGGYARTIGNTINFPAGGSRSMALMIHELTHVWQYQETGWTYAPKALWAQIAEGYSYTDSGKTADQSLKDARATGKTLYDYNKEQQGDILSDYYRRLQQRTDTSAWQPFVDDIKGR